MRLLLIPLVSLQRRAVTQFRSLATAATSTSASGAATPHRPRLEALRQEGLEIDDFLGSGSPIEKSQERVLFSKNPSKYVQLLS